MKNKETEKKLVRDPVCGMRIEPDDAADISIYKNKIFYFCSHGCQKIFEIEPEKYIVPKEEKHS